MNEFLVRGLEYLTLFLAVIVTLTLHEYAHAWMAVRLGDPTPKETGRLSFNPLRHIDPFGFIVMLLVRFGWAKPVEVNPLHFKNPRKGMMITALAGPVMNLILCVACSLLMFFCTIIRWKAASVRFLYEILNIIYYFFMYMVYLNIGLAVFNLIPIHPLDGSRILSYFVPAYANFMMRYSNYFQIGFMLLLILPGFLPIPDIIGNLIYGVQRGVSVSLAKLWLFLFGFML